MKRYKFKYPYTFKPTLMTKAFNWIVRLLLGPYILYVLMSYLEGDWITKVVIAACWTWAAFSWGQWELATNWKWRRRMKEDAIDDFRDNGAINRG
jgi:hypothetical protein